MSFRQSTDGDMPSGSVTRYAPAEKISEGRFTKSPRGHQNNQRVSTLRVHDRPIKRNIPWCRSVEYRSLANGVETDQHRIEQRQKQIDFGKNTVAYDRFIEVCPRHSRRKGDPMTPLPHQICSKRSFMGQVTNWKKKVYQYVIDMDKRAREEQNADDENEEDGQMTAAHVPRSPNINCSEFVGHYKSSNDSTDHSDMEDIELDDHGNVISQLTGITPKRIGGDVDECKEDSKVKELAEASIFTAF